MKKIVKIFAAIAVAGALAGCARTAPVEQVNATVAGNHTAEQVRTAILKAGVQRKWVMTDAGPGVIKGRYRHAITLRKCAFLIPLTAIPSFMTAA